MRVRQCSYHLSIGLRKRNRLRSPQRVLKGCPAEARPWSVLAVVVVKNRPAIHGEALTNEDGAVWAQSGDFHVREKLCV